MSSSLLFPPASSNLLVPGRPAWVNVARNRWYKVKSTLYLDEIYGSEILESCQMISQPLEYFSECHCWRLLQKI